jgi:predicted aspartyl protease
MRPPFFVALFLAFGPVLFGGALSPGAPLITRVGDFVSIPAEISDHAMFVNVEINGHGPFRVLVDTGCSVTLLSPEVAEAVGAVVEDDDEEVLAKNAFGDPVDITRVMLGSVTLGNARFEGVTAAVSDTFQKLSTIEGRKIDGALGFPFFRDVFLGLDLPHKRLLLGSHWPADVPPIRASLEVIEHADVPFVRAMIQGKAVEVMIDTGSNEGLQIPQVYAPAFLWKVEPKAGPLVAVFGETGPEKIGRLTGSLLLDRIERREPVATVSSGPPSIGLKTLENFCVIFHQTENKVWLCGTEPSSIEPEAERSIGLSFYPETGGLRIAGVIPGSPAEDAHLAAGGLVTQIEHRPATTWTRDQLQDWIDSHAAVALVVAEKSGERSVTLPAWDLVP